MAVRPQKPCMPASLCRRSLWILAPVLLFLALLTAPTASAQGSSLPLDLPQAQAVRLEGSIRLDGRMDEDAWGAALPVTRFIQVDPTEGDPVSEPTEIYILYDAEALYVGARLFDSDPVSTRLARRDALVEDSDWFIVALDSHDDRLTAYRFWVNPSGVRRDDVFSSGGSRSGTVPVSGGVIERGGTADASWDPVWSARAAVTDSGWVAEMRIPFGQLRFAPAPVQSWGLQLERRIARRQEQAHFAFTPKDHPAGVALFGRLVDLRGIQAPRPIEILPFVSGGTLHRSLVAQNPNVPFPDPFRGHSDLHADIGADVKYRITSNLTLDATLNPDFGQVELDPAIVNLTAFETRFNEKRPFFVEGADILRFGTSVAGNPEGGPPQLVYSRRIGRAPQLRVQRGAVYADLPDVTTILGAAKLTGRTAGGWSVGILQAVTQHESARLMDASGARTSATAEPFANYFAGRLKRDLRAGRTSFGTLVTAVNRRLDASTRLSPLRSAAYAAGVDFRTESDDRVWSFFGSFSASHIRGSAEAMGYAQRASARYFQRPDAAHLDFDPEATSLSGFRAQIDGGKRAGLWIWNVALTATSPGYEINDMGFQLNSDRIMVDPNITYERNRPGPLFRRWSLRFGPDFDFNFGGDLIRYIPMLTFQSQFHNYWSTSLRYNYVGPVRSDRLTRGGPLTVLPSGDVMGFTLTSDPRRSTTASGGLTRTRDWAGMDQVTASAGIGLKPSPSWQFAVGPNLSLVNLPAQYVTTVNDPTATGTYGNRYVFAPLDQTTLGIDLRLNVTFSPALSLEFYAQPFFSSNDFGAPMELQAPRTFDFLTYGEDTGTIARDADASFVIDPDGAGPAESFRVADRDFHLNSLRGNAVLRWEWGPGRTLYLVWQQDRAEHLGAMALDSAGRDLGGFDLRENVQDLFHTRPINVLLFKVTYWLNP